MNFINLQVFRDFVYYPFLKFGFIFISVLLIFSIFYLFSISLFNSEQLVLGHSIFGGDDTEFNGTQVQKNGNYVVDLLVNPSKPLVNTDTIFLLRLTSAEGDELIELPVSFYILKDGKPVFSNPDNFTIVRQGHYDFSYTFKEPGKYLLFVDIKDIFYTFDIVNFIFEVNVDVPITERISGLLIAFFINYYYIFILIAALVVISIVLKSKRQKILK